jgi:branched-chain amino acid transport system permease protein
MSAASLTDAAPVTAVPLPAAADRRTVTRRAVTGVVLGAAALLPTVADTYTVTLAASAVVLAVLAISVQLLVGTAGLPAFGQAAYFGVGAYTAALLANTGITAGPAHLAAAALTGGTAAAFTAPLVLRTRGTRFLMVTFAVQGLATTIAAQWTTITGGDEGIHTPPVRLWPGGTPLIGAATVYWYSLGSALLLSAGVWVLLRSRLGLALRGCADHEPRMAALGHPVTATLTVAYSAAGALAGAGGALLVAVNRYVSPADMSFTVAALSLFAAAIGAGSMTGAAAGAVLIIACRDGLGGLTAGHQGAVLGVCFLLVAYRAPAWRAITARLRDLRWSR